MGDIKDYFQDATVEQLIKLDLLINEMFNDIKKYGGKIRIMNLNEVKKQIGYLD